VPRGRLARSVGAGALLLACAACGGGSSWTMSPPPLTPSPPAGVRAAALRADQVPAAVRTAYQGAKAVHLKGSITDEGTAVTMDLQLNKDSAAGTVSKDALVIPVLLAEGVYYFQYTDSVMKQAGVSPASAAGRKLRNKWVPSTSAVAASLAAAFKPLLSYDELIGGLAGKIGSQSYTGSVQHTTTNGVPALHYAATDGSSLEVAAAEPHYPLRITGPPAEPGSIDFTGWDQPVPVTKPPASAIYAG
jgi:hypothetical protein